MLKRLFDLIAAAAGLIVAFPLMLFISVWIKLDSKGPVFYRGVRVGLNGKPFRIYKFRTMVEDADKTGPSSTSDTDMRITRIGKYLRKYKMDELPQLLNVFKGDMSIVGPRPQVQWAVDLYTPEERAILTVRPGITDYASLRFANEGEILKDSTDPDKDYLVKIHPEKTKLALEYVKNHTLLIDLKLILKTIAKVLGC